MQLYLDLKKKTNENAPNPGVDCPISMAFNAYCRFCEDISFWRSERYYIEYGWRIYESPIEIPMIDAKYNIVVKHKVMFSDDCGHPLLKKLAWNKEFGFEYRQNYCFFCHGELDTRILNKEAPFTENDGIEYLMAAGYIAKPPLVRNRHIRLDTL